MGLKPNSVTYLTKSVMEHEQSLINDTNMLLKDSTSFPNGSPLLGNLPSEKDDLNRKSNGVSKLPNGSTDCSGLISDVQKPLYVQINGFNKSLPLDSPQSHVVSPTLPILNSSVSHLSPCLPRNLSLSLETNFNDVTSKNIPGTSSTSISPMSLSNSKNSCGAPGPSGIRPLLNSGPPRSQNSNPRRDIEVTKRRTITDKINRCKEQKCFDFIIPQCEAQSSTQLAMIVRRYKKCNNEDMPKLIRKYVYDEDEIDKKASLAAEAPAGQYDDLTDMSDVETDNRRIEVGALRWNEEKVRHGAFDIRTSRVLEDKLKQLKNLEEEVANMYHHENTFILSDNESNLSEEGSLSCARIRPLVSKPNRRIYRHKFDDVARVDYSQMKPSTSTDMFSLADPRINAQISFIESIPIERRMQAHLHRLSLVPAMTIRKRMDQSIWLNKAEIAEEKQRNGWRRVEEREKRKQREEKEGRTNESSAYEDTDDTDDEYVPKPHVSKVNKSGVEKRKRGRPPKESRDPAMPLTKIGRRQSVVGATRQSRQYDIDDVYLHDNFATGLPQKIDYKEIAIPNWHRMPEEDIRASEFTDAQPCAMCNQDLLLVIAQKHHRYEFEERQRFQAYRDKADRDKVDGATAICSNPSSGQHTPQPLVVPPFDPQSLISPPAESPSSARPYIPRQFIV